MFHVPVECIKTVFVTSFMCHFSHTNITAGSTDYETLEAQTMKYFIIVFSHTVFHRDEPASGTLVTCAQFIFIAIHGFIFTVDFGRKKNKIPMK